jgi:HK97 family phage major capsid protein
MHVDLTAMRQRRDDLAAGLNGAWSAGLREGRNTPTPQEDAAFREWRELADEVKEREADEQRGDLSALSHRFGGTPSTPGKSAMLDSRNLTYRRGDPKTSYLRDLMRVTLNRDDDYSARNRLAEHARQVVEDPAFRELRDLSRVDSDGGFMVPPAWLVSEYVALARSGRATADLCTRQPLPSGTDSINIPKIISGTDVNVQPADNTAVTEVDLEDAFINAPVRTVAGQQSVALQLLDQSPISMDSVIFADLIGAHGTRMDKEVLYGSGSAGHCLGLDMTPGITSIPVAGSTIQQIYNAIANGIQTMHSTRFEPPTVVVLHPRRWGALLALLDTTNRPLFLPNANHPMNAAGIQDNVESQTVVGSVCGLPIVTDPNIRVTDGAGSPTGSSDTIWILRASDLLLWESGIRARVLPEVKAQTLTVVCQVYSYYAFSAQRHVESVVELTGLPAPSFA